jgi:hypothetical protein
MISKKVREKIQARNKRDRFMSLEEEDRLFNLGLVGSRAHFLPILTWSNAEESVTELQTVAILLLRMLRTLLIVFSVDTRFERSYLVFAIFLGMERCFDGVGKAMLYH